MVMVMMMIMISPLISWYQKYDMTSLLLQSHTIFLLSPPFSVCLFVCLFAWIRPPVVYVAWARAGRRGSLRVHSLWLYSFGSWLTTFAPPLPPPRTRDHVWPLTSGSIVSRVHKSHSPLNNMALNCSYKIWFYTLNLSYKLYQYSPHYKTKPSLFYLTYIPYLDIYRI